MAPAEELAGLTQRISELTHKRSSVKEAANKGKIHVTVDDIGVLHFASTGCSKTRAQATEIMQELAHLLGATVSL